MKFEMKLSLDVCRPTTLVTEGEVGPVKLVWAPSGSLLTVPGRWFWCGLCWLFWCRSVGDVHYMLVHYTFSSVWVAEWPPFGKWLSARLAICSYCVLSVCKIYLFPVLVLGAVFVY